MDTTLLVFLVVFVVVHIINLALVIHRLSKHPEVGAEDDLSAMDAYYRYCDLYVDY